MLKDFSFHARTNESQLVRLYLASALQRLPVAQRWDIIAALISHPQDQTDVNLPCMIWYGLEPVIASDPSRAAGLLTDCKIPKIQEFIARRMAVIK